MPATYSDSDRTDPGAVSRSPLSKSAQERLIQQYLPLAEHLARRRSYAGRDLDDVRSDALLGLTRAALRFNPDYGVKFSAYARVTIEGTIKHGRRDRSGFDRATYYSNQRPIVSSLDAPISPDSSESFFDRLAAPELDDDGGLREAVNRLPARERVVITLYYWRGLSQNEIGRRLGVSQMTACRIQLRALARLRATFTTDT